MQQHSYYWTRLLCSLQYHIVCYIWNILLTNHTKHLTIKCNSTHFANGTVFHNSLKEWHELSAIKSQPLSQTENVKRQSKNNCINDDNINLDSHNHFMEQAFTKPYPSMECKCTTTKEVEQIIKISQNKKLIWVWWDIYKDPKNKLPFHKFSNKLHM